jgi:hypothetical protein
MLGASHDLPILPMHRLCFGDVLYGLGEEGRMRNFEIAYVKFVLLVLAGLQVWQATMLVTAPLAFRLNAVVAGGILGLVVLIHRYQRKARQ